MLKETKFETKVFIAFGIIAFFAIVLSCFNYFKYMALADHSNIVSKEYNATLHQVVTIDAIISDLHIIDMDYVIDTTRNGDFKADYNSKNFEQVDKSIRKVEELSPTMNSDSDWKILKEKFDTYKKEQGEMVKLFVSIGARARTESEQKKINEFEDTLSKLRDTINDIIDKEVGKFSKLIDDGNLEIQNEVLGSKKFIILFIVLLFAFSLTVIYFLKREISSVISVLYESISGVNRYAVQIGQGNLDLSNRTQEQAGSLEETASTLEEITSTVKQTADNSQRASQLSNNAVTVAKDGHELSMQVKEAMDSISISSNKIADIVTLVNEIAFQTNILAINAAIEAAKAGDQGKGFAVVAIEVRDLAQRSADAAKDIRHLIDDGIEKVAGGVRIVESNGTKLNEITTSIQQVADIMAEILAASKEQYSAIEQINQTVTGLDGVTQQNASLVEEVASASMSMSSETNKVSELLKSFFTLKDEGTTTYTRRDPPQSTKPVEGSGGKVLKGNFSSPKRVPTKLEAKKYKATGTDSGKVVDDILAKGDSSSLDGGEDF